jgi:hypothetical protein
MLTLHIHTQEGWDENKQQFIPPFDTTISLEHSLVSLSKWESKWHKPFIENNAKSQKTQEEIIDYIKCMTITQNVNPIVYNLLTQENLKEINDYVGDTMTATWFNEYKGKDNKNTYTPNRETITSELIYYWMIYYDIPFECQKWHLNRLLTLIRICSLKEQQNNGKQSKMSKRDILSQNAALNKARRARYSSKG